VARGWNFVRRSDGSLGGQLRQPPARVDALQLARGFQRRERRVHRVAEVLISLAQPDDIRPARHVRVRQLEVGLGEPVPGGDDRIEQDRVGPAELEVPVRLLLPPVEHDLDLRLPAEDLMRQRRRERSHAVSLQLLQRAQRGPASDHQLLHEREVGSRDQDAPAQRLGVLEPVHDQVEIAPLERGNQVRPVVLHEPFPDRKARSQRAHQIDFEPHQLGGIAGIAEHVRLTTLQVAGPAELTLGADSRQPGGRKQQCERHGGDRHLQKLPRRRSPW
jgi:hypothetical protein